MQPYDAEFYAEGGEHARRSARHIVPEILRLVGATSVVDVGCGLGTWLSVFMAHGVTDVLGIDGNHVDRARLAIPAEHFRAADLTLPLRLDRTFALALSVEVAEHLPAAAADGFVSALCALAPVVVFSAAVPGQGGVHHVNEQWPDYWASRFLERGYLVADCIRPRFWTHPEVSWWYAQNVCIYVRRQDLARHPELAALASEAPPRSLAHPTLVERNLHRKRLLDTLLEILARAPSGGRVLVADGAQMLELGRQTARGFTWIPFLERGGEYWGAPADGATAIDELERMRREGATAIAFVWPCLWWLERYPELRQHLDTRYRCSHVSPNLVLYDLGENVGC